MQRAPPDHAAGSWFSHILPGGTRPSDEQAHVLDAAARGCNILCRAVAGAGKTTTLLLLAARDPGLRHVLLTYNKRLQTEVRGRARLAAPNTEVHTYHAAAGRAYGSTVRNDEDFRRAVAAPPGTPLLFDVLMLDEAQDMQIEYYAFVRFLLSANPGARVVVVGDALQTINRYRGAHSGFLTEAARIFATGAARSWVSCRLSVSYRLTPSVAAFVNTHLYNAPVLVGGNTRAPDVKPAYYAVGGGVDRMAATLAAVVVSAVAEFGAHNVFVLAASVRNMATSRSPVAQLVRHHLVGIPTYVGGGDDDTADDTVLRGKLAVLSFNAVKGCERPCVVVVGLDETYFAFYARDWADPRSVPNVLTVAATRASRRLVVVAGPRSLRTVDAASLPATADVTGTPVQWNDRGAERPATYPATVSVANLVRHVHPGVVRAARVLITAAAEPDDVDRRHTALADRIAFGPYCEFVGNINGLVVPLLAEVARTGESSFARGIDRPVVVATLAALAAASRADPGGFFITASEHAGIPSEFWDGLGAALGVRAVDRSVNDWVVLAVAVQAFADGRYHIARQISDYAWVDGAGFRALGQVVARRLGAAPGVFRRRLPRAVVGDVTVHGRADFVEDAVGDAVGDAGIVWAFKLGALSEEHELQLGCWLALCGGGEGVLMSLREPESRRLRVRTEDATALLAILVTPPPSREPPVDTLIAQFDGVVGTA